MVTKDKGERIGLESHSSWEHSPNYPVYYSLRSGTVAYNTNN